MHVVAHEVVPYRLRLTEAVTWGGARRTVREGVLLRLEDAEGRLGWGDAAPLSGFSRETVEEASEGLVFALDVLAERDLDPAVVLDAHGPFHAALDAVHLPPSARFALDLALADLAAQHLDRTLPQALHPDPAVGLPLGALLMGETGRGVLDEAVERVLEGYRTLKLKVGRGDPDAEAALVQALRQRVGDRVEIRLDANRAWAPSQARAFAEAVASARPAYVEEPLADPAGLPELWLDTGLPLALDETLAEPGGADALRGWAAAAVLKPTLVGGLAATLRLAARARSMGVRPVLSAAFESGVGLRGVAALGAATGGEAAGLDPYRWLAEDVVGPLPFLQPSVDVPALFRQPVEVRLP